MTKLIDLNKKREESKGKKRAQDIRKRAKIISDDLENVLKVMDLTLSGLRHYNKYIQVMETISCIQNNKTLIEIHLNKYKRLVENEDSMEKDKK